MTGTQRWATSIAACGCVAIVVAGGVRVVSSLEHTDHVSSIEKFALDLEARKEAGEQLSYPVQLPAAGAFHTKFLFYRDYHLETQKLARAERRKKNALVLSAPRGTP